MKEVLLIDANSLIHRCYHAIPQLSNKKGNPTGALYGVANVLLKVVADIHPDYAVALFDRPEPTFRKEKFDDYKAQRPKAEDELISQIIRAHNLFLAFNIPFLELPGYEADDLIGTLATKLKKEAHVTIFTGDLDSLQLVDDGRVVVETFKKGISETIVYNEQAVFDRLGVWPNQVVDFKALVGDASDNIPGVAGVGPKTAAPLLQKYKTLESVLQNATEEKAYEKIKAHEKEALLSQDLAQIILDAPLDTNIEDIRFNPKQEKIEKYFQENDFDSLLKRLDGVFNPIPKTTPAKKQVATQSITTHQGNALVGFGLKEIHKTTPLKEPYFDVDIARQLLGIPGSSWQEVSMVLFKKELGADEFLIEAEKETQKEMQQKGVEEVFKKTETPLIPILADMEKQGVCIDTEALSQTQNDINAALEEREKIVRQTLGEDINLNSPKQVLAYFKEKGAKITSTGAEKLEKIKDQYPVVEKLLAYRELFKLKTTYTDAFEKLLTKDKKIHPTFLQLGAATGRLSCQNPNLQNIPQESEWSGRIRNVFVPQKDFVFVSFDYSQIELRVLASLSKDPNMMSAFENGEDIHRLTASRVFGVATKDVTSQQRRIAKTLNFGIIYGMGVRAFAQQSGLSQQEAKGFIEKYFAQFSSVKGWQEKILTQARRTKVARSMTGRFREVRSINSPNQRFASEAERIALNMPLQSLAADILKSAMVKVQSALQKEKLEKDVHMLLTIHDELLFEIKDNEKIKETAEQIIKRTMESAFVLNVPLIVEKKEGSAWGKME